MKLSKPLILLLVSQFSMSLVSLARAECDPKDFTIQDVEKIDFSDLVRDTAYYSLDTKSAKNSAIAVALQYGPYKGSYEERHSEFEKRLENSGYSFDRDTRLAIVRSALSATGERMYEKCLGSESYKVDIPKNAFGDANQFTMTIRRKLSKRSPRNVQFSITADNGLVNGQRKITGTLTQDDAKDFTIRKTNKSAVSLTFIVDGEPSRAVVPPPLKFPIFDYVERRGQAGIPRGNNGDGNSCTDQAYLVSELGAGAGNSEKECVLCVKATPDAVLVKSTAEVVGQLSARGATKEVLLKPTNPAEVCGRFSVSGSGKNSGRFEVYKGAYFKVFEAVPRK